MKDEIQKKVQLKKDLKHNKYHHKNDNQIWNKNKMTDHFGIYEKKITKIKVSREKREMRENEEAK